MRALRLTLAVALLLVSQGFASARPTAAKIDFWKEQRKGANYHNQTPTKEWWLDAKAAGLEVVRLFPNNWPREGRDFLIGDADRYEKIGERDFQTLKQSLDDAHAAGIGVVITTTSLPGARWRQQNDEKDDRRLWQNFDYHKQAAAFWKDLAARLKDHKAVVGYNIINEPHPERGTGFDDFWWDDFLKWYANVENTPADLNKFYAEVVVAIRKVDRETPVVLDSGLYATPWAFKYLRPIKDKRVIYSFHMAEPWVYTTRRINQGRFKYPGIVVIEGGEGRRVEKNWNAEELERFLAPIAEWQKKYKVPSSRIFVGEFGCSRSVEGAAEYLSDLVRIFDKNGWHWAFYQFRADSTWTERDYEYGTRPPGAGYWDAIGRGERPTLPRVEDNPVWNVLRKALRED